MLSGIYVNKDALIHNITMLHKLHPNKKSIAVVKANAYGVGMKEVVPIIEEKVDAFAVDDIHELYALRFLTDKDVYMLGYIAHSDIADALQLGCIFSVYDTDTLTKINKTAGTQHIQAQINIKIDAHLGRQGVLPDECVALFNKAKASTHIRVRGVYAHFANIEDTTDPSHANKQIQTYTECVKKAQTILPHTLETHISSTAGALIYEDAQNGFSHIRLGVGLYGLWPSQKVRERVEESLELKPVITWYSHLAQVKRIPKGETIGYGLSYKAKSDMLVGVVPQGYCDGLDRKLSNRGGVLVQGKRCPIRGRVSMNMCIVDLSAITKPHREDEVVLLGTQGGETITAEEIAAQSETINYEVMARLNPLLPRRVV